MVVDADALALLALAGMAAGFVDTIGGGGGLITLPMLLLVQIPPLLALATNRLQATFGTFVAAATLWRRGVLDVDKETGWAACASFTGALLGTLFVIATGGEHLDVVVPCVLGCVGVYFLLNPIAGHAERNSKLAPAAFNGTIIPAIGFYVGALGPGSGSFFTLAGLAVRGRSIVKATAQAKSLDFAGNLASLIIFSFSGKVVITAGLAMIVGQLFGAIAGSIVIVRSNGRFIRPVIVTTCFLMLGKYLLQKGII